MTSVLSENDRFLMNWKIFLISVSFWIRHKSACSFSTFWDWSIAYESLIIIKAFSHDLFLSSFSTWKSDSLDADSTENVLCLDWQQHWQKCSLLEQNVWLLQYSEQTSMLLRHFHDMHKICSIAVLLKQQSLLDYYSQRLISSFLLLSMHYSSCLLSHFLMRTE